MGEDGEEYEWDRIGQRRRNVRKGKTEEKKWKGEEERIEVIIYEGKSERGEGIAERGGKRRRNGRENRGERMGERVGNRKRIGEREEKGIGRKGVNGKIND